MEIRWLGKSTFHVQSGASRVFFDPFPNAPKPPMRSEGTTIITSSHEDQSRIKLGPWRSFADRVLEGPGEYEIDGLAFRGIPAPREDPEQDRAVGTIFVMEAERMTVCHLGPLKQQLSAQARQMVGPVDILFVPSSGKGILTSEEAAAAIRQIDPKIVIPMNYLEDDKTDELTSFQSLISEIGVGNTDPQPRLSIGRGSLPSELRVVVLRPVI